MPIGVRSAVRVRIRSRIGTFDLQFESDSDLRSIRAEVRFRSPDRRIRTSDRHLRVRSIRACSSRIAACTLIYIYIKGVVRAWMHVMYRYIYTSTCHMRLIRVVRNTACCYLLLYILYRWRCCSCGKGNRVRDITGGQVALLSRAGGTGFAAGAVGEVGSSGRG